MPDPSRTILLRLPVNGEGAVIFSPEMLRAAYLGLTDSIRLLSVLRELR